MINSKAVIIISIDCNCISINIKGLERVFTKACQKIFLSLKSFYHRVVE